MAPSFDALVTYPPQPSHARADSEQHKSSDYISRGLYPQGKGVLTLGQPKSKKTIWGEYKKAVDNPAHKKFYTNNGKRECHVTFIMISNKPLVNFSNLQANAELLPPNTLVISHETFKQYCSSMCTHAIYISKVPLPYPPHY